MFMRSMVRPAVAFVGTFALMLCKPAIAVEEDTRLWVQGLFSGSIQGAWRWTAEVQPRFRNDMQDFDQLLVRPSVSYALTDKTSVSLGYAYVETETARQTTQEDRWWGQLQHQWGMQDWTFVSRTRFEQRQLNSGDGTSYRLRQLFRASHPWSPGSAWHALAWNEWFGNMNDTRWAGADGINQNRLFLGTQWRYAPQGRLEVGYLNQTINVTNGRENAMNHVLATTWVRNF